MIKKFVDERGESSSDRITRVNSGPIISRSPRLRPFDRSRMKKKQYASTRSLPFAPRRSVQQRSRESQRGLNLESDRRTDEWNSTIFVRTDSRSGLTEKEREREATLSRTTPSGCHERSRASLPKHHYRSRIANNAAINKFRSKVGIKRNELAKR